MLEIRRAVFAIAVVATGAWGQEGSGSEGDPDAAAPVEVQAAATVAVVNEVQIESMGRPPTGDVLQASPEEPAIGINQQFSCGGDGSPPLPTGFNLHGLGIGRTLVLLNGRRFVAGGMGANASVDLRTIPAEALQRFEVLKDGTSAVYGSDAISGAVNIVTRKDFSGTEISIYGGTSSSGDGTLVDLSGSTGQVTDRGHLFFSGGFTRQQPVRADDRSWSRYGRIYDFSTGEASTLGSASIPQGRLFTAGATGPGNAAWIALQTGYPNVSSFTLDAATNQWRPYNSAGVTEAGGDQYDEQPERYLVTPQQRGSLFADGEYKLSPDVHGYFEASFINLVSELRRASEPLFIGATAGPMVISAQNPYNPFNKDFASFSRRLVELTDRAAREDANTFRLVTGVTGVLPSDQLGNWTWDVSLNLIRKDATVLERGNLQRSRLQDAIGPGYRDPATGQYLCGTPGHVIAGCVPLDLFGGAANQPVTPEMARYLSYDGTTQSSNQHLIIDANLTGELFRITPSAHRSSFALGYEHREEAGQYIPDPLTAKGDTTGNKGESTSGSFGVNEGYLQIQVPVIGHLEDGPGGKDLLELTLAARLVSHATFGSNLSYKAGIQISPVADVALRGTYSTAFRTPSIGELYSGQFDGFQSARDPCSATTAGERRPQGTRIDAACDAAGVPDDFYDDRTRILARQGGNPNLQPETARIFTVGLAVEPRFLKDLSVTIDSYDINVQSPISTIGAPLILQGCFPATSGQSPQYCDQIERDPTTHFITTVSDSFTNAGGVHVRGAEIGLRYEPETPAGRFLFDVNAARLSVFDTLLAGGKLVHGKGNYDLGVHPDWTGNAGITWDLFPLRSSLRARFVGPFKECSDAGGTSVGGTCWVDPDDPTALQNPSRTVQPYFTVDANLTWTLDSGLGTSTISAGVNNVLNVEPAKVWNGPIASSDPSAYDFMGRYFHTSVTHYF